MLIGIDDLNLAGGRRAVATADLAAELGLPASDLLNTGFTHRGVLGPDEDPVTLAADAARPIVEAAGRDRFGLLLVATETGLDDGKPLSTYLHRALGLTSACRNGEVKHACYGGTLALRLANDWVRSPASRGRSALVVTTDVCRPHSGPTALTAGVGAVAMSVTRDPAILAMDPVSGSATAEVWDVARPTRTTEWGDAMLSLHSFLDLLELAWEDLGVSPDDFDHLLYHCPLFGLVRAAHALAAPADTSELAEADLHRRVLPALGLNRLVSNIYSGSLYASLAGLLSDQEVPAGARIAGFSYGSGACAELWTGTVQPNARARLSRHRLREILEARPLVAAADALLADREGASLLIQPDLTPAPSMRPGDSDAPRLRLAEIRGYHRRYEWVS